MSIHRFSAILSRTKVLLIDQASAYGGASSASHLSNYGSDAPQHFTQQHISAIQSAQPVQSLKSSPHCLPTSTSATGYSTGSNETFPVQANAGSGAAFGFSLRHPHNNAFGSPASSTTTYAKRYLATSAGFGGPSPGSLLGGQEILAAILAVCMQFLLLLMGRAKLYGCPLKSPGFGYRGFAISH
jgi:hypothetical protein